jgi:hypothetical protein
MKVWRYNDCFDEDGRIMTACITAVGIIIALRKQKNNCLDFS